LEAVLENPAGEAWFKDSLLDDSSVLSDACSPQKRRKILEAISDESDAVSLVSLSKRANSGTVLIEYDEYQARQVAAAARQVRSGRLIYAIGGIMVFLVN
jgi:hypothetical protein